VLNRTASVLLTAAALAAAAPAARAQRPAAPSRPAQDCARCHSSREFLLLAASGRNPPASLVITRAHLAGSAHATTACHDCHRGVDTYPHDPAAATNVQCGTCHPRENAEWHRSVHAEARGDSVRATCADCHGGHDIAPKGFLPTAEGRQAMHAACATCHPEQVRTAERDIHSDTIPCTACHGAHGMRPARDPATGFVDLGLARNCSRCHAQEAATYWADLHGTTAAAQAAGREPFGEYPAPTCVSCHGEHGIRRAHDPSWRFAVSDACITCHAAYGTTYRESYHGQASKVGSEKAAECQDCHTPHNVRPASDTASSVSAVHRTATCQQCHTNASARFASYAPHANPRDRAQNPLLFWIWAFMNSVLTGTMLVWGTHTLAWYRRTWFERRARRAAGKPRVRRTVALDAALRGEGPFVWRFGVVFRIVHAMIVATFFVLVITGLPLRFSCTAWAPDLMALLGGPATAGLVHRIAGAFVFGYFALYAGHVTLRFLKTRQVKRALIGPDAILFRKKDVTDAVQMVRWFLGKGPMPKFDRYSYMEKFDYFAELWGVGVIGLTGLMLWQPVFFARFFPGSLFNIAIIIHSYEAMIATAFIFVVHFFNVHLRVDKWPLDAVMLHGRATMAYMEEEHPLLAERLHPTLAGQAPSARAVADAPAPPPPAWLNRVAAATGLLLLGIGMVLIGLILWGSLC